MSVKKISIRCWVINKDFDPDPPFFPFGVLDSVDFDDLDLEDVGLGNVNGNDNGNVNKLFYLLWLGLYTLPLFNLSLFAAFSFLENLDDLSEDLICTVPYEKSIERFPQRSCMTKSNNYGFMYHNTFQHSLLLNKF